MVNGITSRNTLCSCFTDNAAVFYFLSQTIHGKFCFFPWRWFIFFILTGPRRFDGRIFHKKKALARKCNLGIKTYAYSPGVRCTSQGNMFNLHRYSWSPKPSVKLFYLLPFMVLRFDHRSRLISLKGGILSVFISRKFQPL